MRGHLATRKLRQLKGQFHTHGRCQRGGGRQQHHLRTRVVFRLRKQVRGNEVCTCRVVGDDEDFRGAGRQVERSAFGVLRDQHLGCGDPGIAGAKDFVHLGNGAGAVGHGGYRLCTAGFEDLRDTTATGGIKHPGVRGTIGARWCAQHAHRATCQLRRHG